MPPPARSDPTLEVVVRGLAPWIGENMARAAVEGQAEKLGLRGKPIDAKEVESLLAVLSPGLNVFIGREKTAQIVAEIRESLAAKGRP